MVIAAVTAVLIASSAFFVAAEFALLAARPHRIEERAAASRSARAALRSSTELTVLLAGCQLGITACALGLGAVTKPAVHHWLTPLLETWGAPLWLADGAGFALALVFVTVLHLVVGEMAPKSWAISHPESSAIMLAIPMRIFMAITRPLLTALNGAAHPHTHLPSELFASATGAFTGAGAPKPGRIELAQGGVLFLDEVGETSPSVQAKLLRVLEEREFQRLGGTRTLKADLRVVAATNRDLRAAMARGTFREDLFYRLAVFEIRVPPLRERTDDILPLAGSFLEEIGSELGRPAAGISRDAKEALLGYSWPGNVRELRNVLERASILCDGGLVTNEHLVLPAAGFVPAGPAGTAPPVPASSGEPPPGASPGASSLADLERSAIERALTRARFNKSRAARALGLTRGQLYGKLRRLGISEPD